MTATPANPTSAHSTPDNLASRANGGSAQAAIVSRSRVSGWVLVRVLFLITAQLLMIATLMTAHRSTTTSSTSTTSTVTAGVRQVAFSEPLASRGEAGVRASGPGGSMSCAGRPAERGSASATGFSLDVVIGRGDRSGPGSGQGPLVVTCGDQGGLMILACSPFGGDVGRAPAGWNRPTAGGIGWPRWAPAGWDGTGWPQAWRRDWRGQGLSDDQLDMLNQLTPDQLRALLGQRYPTSYSGHGDGSVAGFSLGGMRISLGTPISLNQLPHGAAYADPYSRSNAPAWGDPWASSWDGAAQPGYGLRFGPSGLDEGAGSDDEDPPALISTSHRHSHANRVDDPDEDDGPNNARGWGGGPSGQRVAVCRWIGQR
jgi:hypothetical protein